MPTPRYSSRLRWDLAPNRLTRLLDERRSAGAAILDLTESNPTAAGFAYPSDQILAALADPRALRYEPAAAGMPSARAAVSQYYSGRVDPGRILLTASTSEAYAFVFKLLADPGDEVLVPRPSYPLFDYLAALDAVRVVQYPLAYHGTSHGTWAIDFDALARSITPRTRAIVLVNPNNPTGSFLKRAELGPLVALCREHNLALISDEVFSDYALHPDQPQLVRSLTEVTEVLTFCLSGLSKVAGLPQMKLGWIVTNGPTRERDQAFDRLELIADTYLSVSAPVQLAAPALLGLRTQLQNQILERVRANRAFVLSQIGPASPWRLLETEGGWYAILESSAHPIRGRVGAEPARERRRAGPARLLLRF